MSDAPSGSYDPSVHPDQSDQSLNVDSAPNAGVNNVHSSQQKIPHPQDQSLVMFPHFGFDPHYGLYPQYFPCRQDSTQSLLQGCLPFHENLDSVARFYYSFEASFRPVFAQGFLEGMILSSYLNRHVPESFPWHPSHPSGTQDEPEDQNPHPSVHKNHPPPSKNETSAKRPIEIHDSDDDDDEISEKICKKIQNGDSKHDIIGIKNGDGSQAMRERERPEERGFTNRSGGRPRPNAPQVVEPLQTHGVEGVQQERQNEGKSDHKV